MAKMLLGALVLIFSLVNIFTDAAPVSRAGAGEAADPSSSSSSSVLYYNHQPAEPARAPASPSRARPKRCTCYSYKDMECVYYCHLGIIWINTPQRTVPYGMSSYRSAQRVRRSSDTIGVQRCTCAEFSDAQCHDFCDARTQNRQKIDRTLPWVKSCLHLYPSSFCDQDS